MSPLRTIGAKSSLRLLHGSQPPLAIPAPRVQARRCAFKIAIGDSFCLCSALFLREADTAMTPPRNVPVQNTNVRELCKSVLEEEDSSRMKLLLDELYRALDERELLTSLL